jgi:hypothetical protein
MRGLLKQLAVGNWPDKKQTTAQAVASSMKIFENLSNQQMANGRRKPTAFTTEDTRSTTLRASYGTQRRIGQIPVLGEQGLGSPITAITCDDGDHGDPALGSLTSVFLFDLCGKGFARGLAMPPVPPLFLPCSSPVTN